MSIKKVLCGLSLLIGIPTITWGQILPPYTNNFDLPGDTAGWSHYALSGSDDWKRAMPLYTNFNAAYSAPYAWGTNLSSQYVQNADRALETPYFNLAGANYMVGFFQKRHSVSPAVSYIMEYKIGSAGMWQVLLNNTGKKKNWQGTSGFTGNYTSGFQYSAVSLDFLQGTDSVKFRFRFVSANGTGEGWLIDNFTIVVEALNAVAVPADSVLGRSRYCSSIPIKTTLYLYNTYGTYHNKTNYYISSDTILDAGDTYLASYTLNLNSGAIPWNYTVTVPNTLPAGYHYILYQHDYNDSIPETNENDNVGRCVIQLDSTYVLPYIDDLETLPSKWKMVKELTADSTIWQFGKGYTHHLEDVHSGIKSWHTGGAIYYPGVQNQWIVSPYLDLSSQPGPIYFNVWFKDQMVANAYVLEYYANCDPNFWGALANLPANRDDEWDFINIPLSSISTYKNIKLRLRYKNSYLKEGLNVDDIYIGPARPDLTIERDKRNRFTDASQSMHILRYFLSNAGPASAPATQTAFYWSTDTLLDAADQFLGFKAEPSLTDTLRMWTTFSFTKPTTAAGSYYIFYILDSTKLASEMREYNNRGYFVLRQEMSAQFPYFNNFESQVTGWYHDATLGKDEWSWTTPGKPVINQAFSGTKAWITNDTGVVSSMSRMHLYTPLFDLSTAVAPVLEFDMKLHHDNLSGNYMSQNGRMNVSYSVDGGATWLVLDTSSQSFKKWYYWAQYEDMAGIDKEYYSFYTSNYLMATSEKVFSTYRDYNGRDEQDNYKYILDIKNLAGYATIQFRFNLAVENHDGQYPVYGPLIDNFKLSEAYADLRVDYKKALMASSLAKDIKLEMHIKNAGNYLAPKHVVKYYLSVDTTLDGSDYVLGGDTLATFIRPNHRYYLNTMYPAPVGLSIYKYLLYELDATNLVSESSETNNIGYWRLALDSVNTYPYLENFEDTIINGWHSYTTRFGAHQKRSWRFRNLKAPGEFTFQPWKVSGQMTADIINPTISQNQLPYRYLESPAYNFTNWDTIHLSFKLLCIGANTIITNLDGGNLEYSTNGGLNWHTLDSLGAKSYNWYDYQSVAYLSGQAGWVHWFANVNSLGVILDSCFSDISFLKGNSSVSFRFKYRSNAWPTGGNSPDEGMRVDDFRISAKPSSTSTGISQAQSINLYYSSGSVYINLKDQPPGMYTVEVFNVIGQQMVRKSSSLNTYSSVPLNLPNGIYTINVYGEAGGATKKIIIQD